MLIKITEDRNDKEYPFTMFVNGKKYEEYASLTSAINDAKVTFKANSEAFQIVPNGKEISINFLRLEN